MNFWQLTPSKTIGFKLDPRAIPDEDRAMIKVRSQPVVEPDPKGGWQLIFLMGGPFDYTTAFRSALSDMTEILSREVPSSIQLPEYEEHEDFVEGVLHFGDEVLRVYYEHSLSYLSISTISDDTLRDVAARLRSTVNVAPSTDAAGRSLSKGG
jgi:hypothetical protein